MSDNDLSQNLMLMLGNLQSDIKHIRSKVDAVDIKVERTNDMTIEIKGNVTGAHKRLDRIEPKVEEHEKFKNKQHGIMATVIFIVGLVGTGVGALIAKF